MAKFKVCTVLIVVCIALLLNEKSFSQTATEKPDSMKIRKVYFAIGSGYPEFMSVRLGYQINNQICLTAKCGAYANGSKSIYLTSATLFWSLKGAYFFKNGFLDINNIALNIGYANGDFGRNNYLFEFSFGEEPIDNKWFSVYWAATLNVMALHTESVFFTPGLTAGIIFCF